MKCGGKSESPGCSNEQHKKYRVCDPCRGSKRKYGLTVPQRQALLDKQDNLCAICGIDIYFDGKPNPKRGIGPTKNSAVVDHCHGTNEVRGVLCHVCNRILGMIDKVADHKILVKNILNYYK